MYRDSITSTPYPFAPTRWLSDEGHPLDLAFEPPALDWARVRARPPGLWRYREVLPLEPGTEAVSLGETTTPIVRIEHDGAPLAIKQDQLFPTGSYKDRGAAVLVSFARERGVTRVIQDSSGNAGAAIAAYCARAGIACTIYVPADTSPSKLVQMRLCGAEVVLVPGSREDTARAARAAASESFYASHCWNPVFLHGTKTFAYEVFEQYDGRVPDAVLVPVGNGTLLLGAALGFAELVRAGVIAKSPALYGVQSSACRPILDALEGVGTPSPVGPTLAEGIAIAEPPRAAQIVAALKSTRGGAVGVDDDEVRSAVRTWARRGVFMEPTSAATLAAVPRIRAKLRAGAELLTVVTGTGLKATDKLVKLGT